MEGGVGKTRRMEDHLPRWFYQNSISPCSDLVGGTRSVLFGGIGHNRVFLVVLGIFISNWWQFWCANANNYKNSMDFNSYSLDIRNISCYNPKNSSTYTNLRAQTRLRPSRTKMDYYFTSKNKSICKITGAQVRIIYFLSLSYGVPIWVYFCFTIYREKYFDFKNTNRTEVRDWY